MAKPDCLTNLSINHCLLTNDTRSPVVELARNVKFAKSPSFPKSISFSSCTCARAGQQSPHPRKGGMDCAAIAAPIHRGDPFCKEGRPLGICCPNRLQTLSNTSEGTEGRATDRLKTEPSQKTSVASPINDLPATPPGSRGLEYEGPALRTPMRWCRDCCQQSLADQGRNAWIQRRWRKFCFQGRFSEFEGGAHCSASVLPSKRRIWGLGTSQWAFLKN